ncbi:MAG: cysteine desulfurase family protein, partial [Promethearchaeota archaeon]
SAHSYGMDAYEGLDWARSMCAQSLNGIKEEILFTSGGSESDNLALQGVISRYRRTHPGKTPHLIIDTIEHPAVFETAKYLENKGVTVTRLPVDAEGLVKPEQVEAAITPETALISIMYANNEIGTINPIGEIGKIAHQHGILFHTDAVQAYTKVMIDVQSENIDLLSVSAHKFYGPKGVGFLYVRNDPDAQKNESTAFQLLDPLMYGGSQESNMRPATENVPGVVGMAKAIELADEDFKEENTRLKGLRDNLINHILKEIPNTQLNGSRSNRLPHNVNICFQDVFAYDLMIKLDNAGIMCSVGAACHAGDTTPSRVLLGIGLSSEQAESSMRFSIGRWTTQEDVDTLLQLLDKFVPTMRG